ncbi:MAG: hypothetical protein EPO08_09025 [Rhodospirillaceae bacterium]|nr:MAG: hypothetical protein EPO08_09025 [Rhodospirillaceae bacterium]
MLFRIIAGLLGVFYTANGFHMLTAPEAWFMATPGAAATGPFNPHFVMDVGFAFLAGGLAFLAFAWRPNLKLIALGASGFIVFHALFHLSDLFQGHMDRAAVAVAIAVPAFLGLVITWPRKGEV